MESQPLYIKGVSVKPTNITEETYKFRKETTNALKAAAAYLVTMVLSLIYPQLKETNLEMNPHIGRICHFRRLISSAYFRYRRRHYDDIPDNNDSLRRKSFGGGHGALLPLHSNGEDRMLKSRKRVKKNSVSGDGGNAMEGFMGKIKSWGIGGGSSATGRKKDR